MNIADLWTKHHNTSSKSIIKPTVNQHGTLRSSNGLQNGKRPHEELVVNEGTRQANILGHGTNKGRSNE